MLASLTKEIHIKAWDPSFTYQINDLLLLPQNSGMKFTSPQHIPTNQGKTNFLLLL